MFGGTGNATSGGGFSFGGAPTSLPATGGFSFGAAQTSTPAAGGFSFASTPATTTSSTGGGAGFSFGSTATSTPAIGGFSLGGASSSAAGGGIGTGTTGGFRGFSLGGAAPPTTSATAATTSGPSLGAGSFNFGAAASKPSTGDGTMFGGNAGGGLSLGTPSATAAAPTTAATSIPAPQGGLSTGSIFGVKQPTAANTTASGLGGFSGLPTATTGGSLLSGLLTSSTTTASAPSATTSAAASTGFSFGTPTSSAAPTPAATAASSGPGLGTTIPGSSLGQPAPTTTTGTKLTFDGFGSLPSSTGATATATTSTARNSASETEVGSSLLTSMAPQPGLSAISANEPGPSGLCLSATAANEPGPSGLCLSATAANEPGPSGLCLSATAANEPGPSGLCLFDTAANKPGPSGLCFSTTAGNKPGPSGLHFTTNNEEQPAPSGLCPSASDANQPGPSEHHSDGPSFVSSPCDETVADNDQQASAAYRKITLMSTPAHVQDDEGYLLIHMSFLISLISAVACPQCSNRSLQIKTDYKGGLSSKALVSCSICEETIFAENTSPGGKRKDITKRVVLAAKNSGLGYEGLCNFFSILNMKKPLHHKTFQEVSRSVHEAAVSEAEKCMIKAANIVAESTTEENPGQSGVPATTISYDGTWHKRGHSSHFGVGVAIDCRTGFVLDTQVLSNYCHGCEVGPKPDDQNYLQWRVNHQCQKNFGGSANAMEANSAVAIFGRSIEKRNLVYTRMLCDGDAKSHQLINNSNIYDFEVIKEDCINHISKRMFNALEAAKNANKKELNRKLTKTNIEKITNTYATNLKRSAPDVEQMRLDVMGGFYHMMSTDKKPRHHLCPEGIHSWCFYQRAMARNEEPRSHNVTIKPGVEDYVLPIVERLTHPDLLARCAAMQTQNPNECFNSLIWSRCPKTEFASRRSIETAIALSVLSFNAGPAGIYAVLQAMSISVGQHHHQHSSKKQAKKLELAQKRAKRLSKWARKEKKRRRLQIEDRQQREEGETYAAGAFNL